MSIQHNKAAFKSPAYMTPRRFASLSLADKAHVIRDLGSPPARPDGDDPRQLVRYWREVARLGEIDRKWHWALNSALPDIEDGTIDIEAQGFSDVVTPEMIACCRSPSYLAAAAKRQSIANRSAAIVIGLSQGMDAQIAETMSNHTGEVKRILACPGMAVDRLVHEGFLSPDKAYDTLISLKDRAEALASA